MAPDALKGIRDVYFHGDMEAAPALAGQSASLIDAVKSAQQIIAGMTGLNTSLHRTSRCSVCGSAAQGLEPEKFGRQTS